MVMDQRQKEKLADLLGMATIPLILIIYIIMFRK